MAYKQDQEEARADKGLLIAKIVASIVVTIIIIVGFKIMFNTLWSSDDKMDLLKLQVEAELLKETINYNVTSKDGALEVNLWDAGNVKTAKGATMGDDDSIAAWGTTKEKMQYLSSVFYEKRYLADLPDTSVVLKLVNEDNHARALLVYKDGILTYDVVNEVKGD